jgi:ribosome modulation factor
MNKPFVIFQRLAVGVWTSNTSSSSGIMSMAICSFATGGGATDPAQDKKRPPKISLFRRLWMTQGWQDYFRGYSASACPYTGEGRRYWLLGWSRAKNKQK